jgi:hypothetical protein
MLGPHSQMGLVSEQNRARHVLLYRIVLRAGVSVLRRIVRTNGIDPSEHFDFGCLEFMGLLAPMTLA